MRTLRLILALAIVVQGIASRDTVMIVLGVLFGGMAVANIGCCGVGGCAVDQRSTNNKPANIEYEEVVSNK
jgi:hypothetical protein